jgi:Na+-transporting methylmalonyl-CoA/oxaloacetate decarboxylase gamma subunit
VEDIMITEGVKLALIITVTVLVFLSLMIVLMKWVSILTQKSANRKLEAIRVARELTVRGKDQAITGDVSDEDIVVISAAVATYELERLTSLTT